MDILLQKFFEYERWEKAINTGIVKDMPKSELKLLCSPDVRIALLNAIATDNYEIAPPHTAQIPKDKPGEFRTVYINENIDRIFLSIANDLFFEMCGKKMVHPACKSYQTGIGTGKIVKEVSSKIAKESNGEVIGFIADLSKYFDSVNINVIDKCFDEIEEITGKSKIIDIVRKYYHTDWCFDLEGNLIEHYQSLKQGCAVASFLADACLYKLDKYMVNNYDGIYVRYSDDICYIGKRHEKALTDLGELLNAYSLTLNPKKVKQIDDNHWFKFLGFLIKGDKITLSPNRVKTFQKEIEKRTIKNYDKNWKLASYKKALNSVNRYLYRGDGKYSWATSVLSIINVEKDIDTLNEFVMDCLRVNMAQRKKKAKLGGLGVVLDKDDCTILRGCGKNVKSNRERTEKELEGYMSIRCMRNALVTCRPVYEALVRQM